MDLQFNKRLIDNGTYEAASVCDINGDGILDIITGGWWGQTLRWRENPGNDGEWKVHDVDVCSSIETIRCFDMDGCGLPEVFPNTPGAPQAYYKLLADAAEASGLGIYFWMEDLTGNGYPDIVAPGKEGLYLFEYLGPEQ